MLNIHLEDIKWDQRQIWVRKGKGNKERFVLFTHECEQRLLKYLEQRKTPSLYLFCNDRGSPLSRVTIQHYFREYSKLLGFKVSPHTLRHSFAAHLVMKDMPQSHIQELMGHVNINSTQVYTRLEEKARKQMYDRYQL